MILAVAHIYICIYTCYVRDQASNSQIGKGLNASRSGHPSFTVDLCSRFQEEEPFVWVAVKDLNLSHH